MAEVRAQDKIETLMGLMDLKKSKVSERISISRTNLSNYLNGKSQIKAETFMELLRVLGIDIQEELNTRIEEELRGIKREKNFGIEIEAVINSLGKIEQKTMIESIIDWGKSTKHPQYHSIKRLEELNRTMSTIRRDKHA